MALGAPGWPACVRHEIHGKPSFPQNGTAIAYPLGDAFCPSLMTADAAIG
jgi:hypothetical protein